MNQLKSAAVPAALLIIMSAAYAFCSPVEMIEQWENGATIMLSTSSVEYEVVVAEGCPYHRISAEGLEVSGEPGAPGLPRVGFTLAMPREGKFEIEIVEAAIIDEGFFNLYPVQPDRPDGAGADHTQPPFVIDEALYESTEPWPVKPVQDVTSGLFGRLPVRSFIVSPFSYTPATRQLQRAERLIIRITWEHELSRALKPVRSGMEKLFSSSILNYETLEVPKRDGRGTTEFLFVTHPDFSTAIEPLAEWEKQKGFPTEIVDIDTSNPQDVKDLLNTYYEDEGLLYAILVGDDGYLPVATWNNSESDTWYSCLTGGGSPDYYPDIGLARLSIADPLDLDVQIDKILAYEKEPPSGNWLEKLTFVAHKEDAPGSGSFVDNKEDIRTEVLAGEGLTIDTYYGHLGGVRNTNVQAAINDGRGIVNYRGHGLSTSWADWNSYGESFGYLEIDGLNNGSYTPIVFNIACLNGRVSGNCLSEAWMGLDQAAVASLAANEVSYHGANNFMDKALFDAIYNEGTYNLALTLVDAFIEMLPHGGTYWTGIRVYAWLGDPTTPFFEETPDELDISAPATFEVGYNPGQTVNVKAGGSNISGALVTIYKADDVLSTATTNTWGNATFNLTFASAGTVRITATKPNYITGRELAAVGSNGHYLAVTLDADDAAVARGDFVGYTVTIKNMGTSSESFDYWTDIYLPGGGGYAGNPLIGPVPVTLSPGQQASGYASHQVPPSAPLYVIDLDGKVGQYPSQEWSGDGFNFEIVD